MSSLAVLQPALTDSISLYSSYVTAGRTVTIADVLSFVNSLNFDSFAITYNTGSGWEGLSTIVPFNVGTRENYYLADGEYLEQSSVNSACFDTYNLGLFNRNGGYIIRPNDFYKLYNQVSGFNNVTKDDITYACYQGMEDDKFSLVYIGGIVTNLYINGALPVLYEWSSVPALSGKNGILSLPMLDSVSWDGTPITNAERDIFTTLPDAANLRSLYSNVVYGEPYPIVFAGDEHVAILTWTNSTTFSVDYKWNYNDVLSIATLTYTLAHAQDEVWFAFASMIRTDPEDPEFEEIRWGRPTFIIRDANTGKYSFGIEQITEAYYPAFYEWHIAGFSADFSVFGDPNEEEGGEGYGDIVDEPIGNPLTPSIGAVATGFTRLYYITGANKSKLTQLMDWFNDEDLQFINQIFKGDPMQALIGVNISPLPLTVVGAPNMYFLGIDTGIASDGVISDQFQEIDCGSIDIELWMKDTYLDFAPYTSIKAILPYIGAIDLNTDDLKYKVDKSGKRIPGGATLSLKYVIDTLTGACVAHLFVNGSLHYEASGSCFISIPLTQKDYTSEINSIKQAVAGVADTLIKSAGLAAMGDLFEWYIQNCLPAKYLQKAEELGISPHQYLRSLSQNQKIGEHGLIAIDWWNGCRSMNLNNNLSGAIIGLKLSTKPEDIYRALIESTAFGIRRILDCLEAQGIKFSEIFATGGISLKDPMLMQICADVFNLPIYCLATTQATALGSAIYGAVAAGIYDDIIIASNKMASPIATIYYPKKDNHEEYEKIYQQYKKLFDSYNTDDNIMTFLSQNKL